MTPPFIYCKRTYSKCTYNYKMIQQCLRSIPARVQARLEWYA
nr:MAG TPA: hypothetical protein [Caudoviricetes sp.]